MSESIESLYQNALLADAAYLNWEQEDGESIEAFKIRMRELLTKSTDPDSDNRVFTVKQAQEFVDRYDVLGFQENTPDGFSATLFFDKELQKEVLAIRGTEPKSRGQQNQGVRVLESRTNV